MSSSIAEMTVRECKASEFSDCDVVFSGLDSDVAGHIGTLSSQPSVIYTIRPSTA
jgi:hypothetical protein